MKRKKTLGQLISTLVFLFAGVWLTFEGLTLYLNNEILKAISVWFRAGLSLLGSMRYVIQNLVSGGKR